jgi:hypothetical protein
MFFTAPAGSGNQYVYDGLKDSVGMSANDMSNYQNAMQQGTNAEQTVMSDGGDTSWYLAPKINQVQNIGDKIFVYSSGSMWVDAVVDSSMVFDTVAYGSPVYFSLAAANPELQDYMSVGSQALINYNGRNYIILDPNSASQAFDPGSQSDENIITGRFKIHSQDREIVFSLPVTGKASALTVYSLRGALVADIPVRQGMETVRWNFGNSARETVPDGIYTAVFRSKKHVQTERFVIMHR